LGPAEQGDIDVPLDQRLLQLTCRRVLHVDLDAGVGLAERGEQLDQPMWTDGAHEAHGETRTVELGKGFRVLARLLYLVRRLLEIGAHDAAEFGQMGIAAFTMDKGSAELVLQVPDRPRQGRLRDVAALGGAGEVERIGERQKVANLVNFHGSASLLGGVLVLASLPRDGRYRAVMVSMHRRYGARAGTKPIAVGGMRVRAKRLSCGGPFSRRCSDLTVFDGRCRSCRLPRSPKPSSRLGPWMHRWVNGFPSMRGRCET